MCGIAGYIGEKKLSNQQIVKCHKSMEQRGPDTSGHVHYKYKKKNISLLHNRLKIIDLSNAANQPFSHLGYTIIFNGEIYNFKDIKKELILKGYKFRTSSDTEVLLKNYIDKKYDAFKDFEGMWSLAIWDDNSKELILSRDRFGQKPLFYFEQNNEIFFGSQINQIKELSNFSFKFNKKKILDYLGAGYRSIFKDNQTFYNKIKHFPPSSYAVVRNQKLFFKKYWVPNNKLNQNISYEDAKIKASLLINKSVKNCLISDQKTSTMLSGGIDSNVIFSCIKDQNHSDITTCSVIDSDSRYDESRYIESTIKDKSHKSLTVDDKYISKFDFIENLRKKIDFYSSPVLTVSSYVSSFLQKKISENGIRVNLSGIGSDEIFSGYYQHHAYFLKSLQKKKDYSINYNYWKKMIYPTVRNPFLKNEKSFFKKENLFKSLFNYNINSEIQFFLKKKYSYKFKEKKFFKNFLKNRMYNELLYENVPTMLFEDDRNHMYYSIENRSPFLDKDLVEFAITLPPDYLIRKGFTKPILRDSFVGKISNKILKNYEKRGFNFNLSKIMLNKRNRDHMNVILDTKTNPIFEFIDFNSIKKILNKKKFLNSETNFLFSLINSFIFLEKL